MLVPRVRPGTFSDICLLSEEKERMVSNLGTSPSDPKVTCFPIWALHPLTSRSHGFLSRLFTLWSQGQRTEHPFFFFSEHSSCSRAGRCSSPDRGDLRSWASLLCEASKLPEAPFMSFLLLQVRKAYSGTGQPAPKPCPHPQTLLAPVVTVVTGSPFSPSALLPHDPPDFPASPSFTEILLWYNACRYQPAFLSSLLPLRYLISGSLSAPVPLTSLTHLLPESPLNSALWPGLESNSGPWMEPLLHEGRRHWSEFQ